MEAHFNLINSFQFWTAHWSAMSRKLAGLKLIKNRIFLVRFGFKGFVDILKIKLPKRMIRKNRQKNLEVVLTKREELMLHGKTAF